MIIYTKSKKDREAVLHVFERVYHWVPVIRNLGVRHSDLEEAIKSLPPEDFTLVLLGKSDARWISEDLNNAWRKVVVFWKEKVHNGRMRDIVSLVESSKTRFLSDIVWNNNYELGKPTNFLTNFQPGDDVYFLPKDWPYKHLVERLLGRRVGTPLVHLRGSTEVFYGGNKPLGTLPREGGRIVVRENEAVEFSKEDLVKKNREHIEEKVDVTTRKLREVIKDREVVVPFSGGKDSAVVLFLAKEAGIDAVPVFVDTGGEHEETYRYVEEVEKIVGKIEVVEAPVAEKYAKLGEGYLLGRSCTRDKIGALYDYVRKHFEDPILVNGDRIAESKARSLRPELRKDEFWVFSPIKYWSYLDEQLFLWSRGYPLNRLYEIGFYRVGCSFCPFTDRIERIAQEVFK